MFARALVALALAVFAAGASAQTYPAKPVRIINPFAPGGATDQLARLMAQKLTELWGQSVVVENRPGRERRDRPRSGREVAARRLHARDRDPDHARREPCPLRQAPVRPGARFRAAYARRLDAARADGAAVARRHRRRRPDRLHARESRQADLRLGRQRHLAAPDDGAAEVDDRDVCRAHSYKGAGPALVDFLGGQTNIMFDNLPTAMPHVKSGKVRALAVSTAKRSALAPELPTMAESGLAGFDLATWFAFFAPAATPKEITAKIAADMQRVLAQPDVKERLLGVGVDVVGSTPDELARFSAPR